MFSCMRYVKDRAWFVVTCCAMEQWDIGLLTAVTPLSIQAKLVEPSTAARFVDEAMHVGRKSARTKASF
jgi:hypothetical protein